MKKTSKVDGHQMGGSLDISKDIGDEEQKPSGDPHDGHDQKSSSKNLIIIFSVIVIVFGVLVFSYSAFYREPMTIHEMHQANLAGELDDEDAYLYNGFSFIHYQDQWWTEFARADGSETYNVQFRYGPKEVEGVQTGGDYLYILNFPEPYITFDPRVEDIQYTALAAADIATALYRAFKITSRPACTVNETAACADLPIMECEPGVPIIHLKQDNRTYVEMDGTCLVIHGKGFDLVKAVDRFLFGVYGIMK